ncbi:uncharacterized protein PGTG_19362 [Puccinia graminis f. sp. tritici CRL 75-36-700-3]|uniref:Myb/SANT-like domain-containing protein n=1 Tax=Puccinia graminis f. sp. tritici (strain CRL 75-36-700-3 / race SCCL) TaxID=418459 RepID=E3L957_PUCGT|nr:uncharacterized protein PGTG_19362 [Puccinia graminis f. sp. tritici CRL 75-36-700-3]EFP93082.1 hypothetical protein PGTG_19362 [Puccinia graminis f. sp. tritici CRL 75-36-700-3]
MSKRTMNHPTPDISSATTANNPKPKGQGKAKDVPRKEPHLWSFDQKKKLLELLLDYSRRGHATDNANLKKDAWALAASDMNEAFDISLDLNHKKTLAKLKRQFALETNDDDDIGDATQPSPSQPAYKRSRDGKNNILSTGIQGLISAIDKASEGSKDLVGAMVSMASHASLPPPLITTLPQAYQSIDTPRIDTPPAPQSPSECALEKLQDLFGDDISDDDFVDYVRIVEDNLKARTFLKLAQTTSPTVVLKWLSKEVLARGTPF